MAIIFKILAIIFKILARIFFNAYVVGAQRYIFLFVLRSSFRNDCFAELLGRAKRNKFRVLGTRKSSNLVIVKK